MTLGPVGTVAHAVRRTAAASGMTPAFSLITSTPLPLGTWRYFDPRLGAARHRGVVRLAALAVVPELFGRRGRRRRRRRLLLDVHRRRFLDDHGRRRVDRVGRRRVIPVRIRIGAPPHARPDADDDARVNRAPPVVPGRRVALRREREARHNHDETGQGDLFHRSRPLFMDLSSWTKQTVDIFTLTRTECPWSPPPAPGAPGPRPQIGRAHV